MKFWDASAIVPLLMSEPTTKTLQALAGKDPTMVVWWATEAECASAIARLEREDALDEAAAMQAFHRLRQLAPTWHDVDPSDPVREAAVRFLRVHPLRAADALQLAAALLPRNGDRHHSRSSHSMIVWPPLRAKKDSP
jgi:predicted nucleic acid-binding protein